MCLVVRHRIEALAGRGRAVDNLFDPDVVAGDFGGEFKRRLAQTMRRALNMLVERCAAGQHDADRAGPPVAVSVCLSQSAPYALDQLRFDIATLEVNLRPVPAHHVEGNELRRHGTAGVVGLHHEAALGTALLALPPLQPPREDHTTAPPMT